eukprot:SAG22_NODE_1428_length_4445_cov_1.417663_1_plen_250_part_00
MFGRGMMGGMGGMGGMGMGRRRGGGGIPFHLIFLAMRYLPALMELKPMATCVFGGAILANTFGLIRPLANLGLQGCCLMPAAVLGRLQVWRLGTSLITLSGDGHLYWVCSSLAVKGLTLEPVRAVATACAILVPTTQPSDWILLSSPAVPLPGLLSPPPLPPPCLSPTSPRPSPSAFPPSSLHLTADDTLAHWLCGLRPTAGGGRRSVRSATPRFWRRWHSSRRHCTAWSRWCSVSTTSTASWARCVQL